MVRCTFTKYRHKANVGLVAHTCPIGEYNEMATLLFSSQEGIVELIFSRHEPGQPEEPLFSTCALASLLGVIFVLSVCIFGIAVPGDNFVPGIVMGGLSGRLFGELLREADIHPGLTPGAFALLGAGAVLTGMSRMTITLVAILTEVYCMCVYCMCMCTLHLRQILITSSPDPRQILATSPHHTSPRWAATSRSCRQSSSRSWPLASPRVPSPTHLTTG